MTQQRYSLRAVREQEQERKRRAEERRQQPPAVRLERAAAAAKFLRLDVRNELRLARLAMLTGRSQAHIERRLMMLERRVFPEPPGG